MTCDPGPTVKAAVRAEYPLAGRDQSLRRMRLDYVDIFYSHRPDPQTPLEGTIMDGGLDCLRCSTRAATE